MIHSTIIARAVRYLTSNMRNRAGFTLPELLMVIVILGILSAVAVPRFLRLQESACINATKQELLTLRRAIIGNPDAISGGQYTDVGYLGDVGSPPPNLEALIRKPDDVPEWDPYTQIGWHGPYIDTTEGDYLHDAWGNEYIYDKDNRTIKSKGPDGVEDTDDDIIVKF